MNGFEQVLHGIDHMVASMPRKEASSMPNNHRFFNIQCVCCYEQIELDRFNFTNECDYCPTQYDNQGNELRSEWLQTLSEYGEEF
jgi:hypothetical protein